MLDSAPPRFAVVGPPNYDSADREGNHELQLAFTLLGLATSVVGVALYTGERAYTHEDRLHTVPIDRVWSEPWGQPTARGSSCGSSSDGRPSSSQRQRRNVACRHQLGCRRAAMPMPHSALASPHPSCEARGHGHPARAFRA